MRETVSFLDPFVKLGPARLEHPALFLKGAHSFLREPERPLGSTVRAELFQRLLQLAEAAGNRKTLVSGLRQVGYAVADRFRPVKVGRAVFSNHGQRFEQVLRHCEMGSRKDHVAVLAMLVAAGDVLAAGGPDLGAAVLLAESAMDLQIPAIGEPAPKDSAVLCVTPRREFLHPRFQAPLVRHIIAQRAEQEAEQELLQRGLARFVGGKDKVEAGVKAQLQAGEFSESQDAAPLQVHRGRTSRPSSACTP